MLMDFYIVEVLAEAKLRLLNDIKDMSLPRSLPHIPQRRCGDSRLVWKLMICCQCLCFLMI